MFSLRSMFMHAVFSVVFVRVASVWIPYNGLWFYISDDTDGNMTYAESKEKCKLLNGRLSQLSGWPDDRNEIASFTGSTRRWIYGLPTKVIYELDQQESGNSGDKYKLIEVNADNKYGYICDWQCHSLSVYPHASFHHTDEDVVEEDVLEEDLYEEDMTAMDVREKDVPEITGPPYDFIRGVYDLHVNRNLRQFYFKQPHTGSYSTPITIYQKHLGDSNHLWCFSKNDYSEDYVCKSSTHFTPYNDSYGWNDDKTLSLIGLTVYFFCHDCDEYMVSLTLQEQEESIMLSDNFSRTRNSGELIMYTNANNTGYLKYDSYVNQWCFKWTPYLYSYCVDYLIAPAVKYTAHHMSLESDIVISLSCKSTTFPVQQSTVASVESDTTMNLDSKETATAVQSTANYHDMTSQLNTVSEISPVSNSQTINTVTDTLDRNTNGPRSNETRLNNKTTIYITIAGAIGGVVLIIIISVAAVCGRRRMKNGRKRGTEINVRRGVHKSEANIYSVENKSSFVVPDKVHKPDTGKSDPLYEEAKDPTKENVYSEAETVDLNNKHMYINSGFVPGANNSQDSSDKQTSGMKTANKLTDDEDSETEFVNNDIYDGNSGLNNRKTDAPQPIPVKSPSGSDIEMFSNSLYEASGKSIDHNNKSELVKKMNNVDEDIEMYDNDLYGS